jgi:hypothetical protein
MQIPKKIVAVSTYPQETISGSHFQIIFLLHNLFVQYFDGIFLAKFVSCNTHTGFDFDISEIVVFDYTKSISIGKDIKKKKKLPI